MKMKTPPRLQKALRELNKQVDSACSVVAPSAGNSGSHPLNLASSQLPPVDRALGEISRALSSSDDQTCFCQLGGVASVVKMLMLSIESGTSGKWSLPQKLV